MANYAPKKEFAVRKLLKTVLYTKMSVNDDDFRGVLHGAALIRYRRLYLCGSAPLPCSLNRSYDNGCSLHSPVDSRGGGLCPCSMDRCIPFH